MFDRLNLVEKFFLDMAYRLSSLTMEEYLTIIGTLKHDYETEFKCKRPEKYDKYEDPLRRRRFHNQQSYCDGRVAKERPSYAHVYKHITFLTCPCTFYDPQVYNLLELEALYHKYGQIPSPQSYIYKIEDKGLLTAPAKLIQAFRLIRSFITDLETKEIKKQEQDLKSRMK